MPAVIRTGANDGGKFGPVLFFCWLIEVVVIPAGVGVRAYNGDLEWGRK